MIDLIEYQNKDVLMTGIADVVAEQLAEILEKKGSASLAVPGGSTPLPFLEKLSHAELDWQNITVFLTDERFVPVTSERSNTRMLRNTIVQNKASQCQFIPFWQPDLSSDELAQVLGAQIAKLLPIDVCVLGMGADMHTASLFPGADRLEDALAEDQTEIMIPMSAATAPEPRLTLTAPVLKAATHLHLLIAGQEKRDALELAMKTESPHDAPVKAVMRSHNPMKVHFAL